MPDEEIGEIGLEVPIVWVGVDDQSVVLANQFAFQFNAPEEFILTIGQIAAPILLGTNEEKLEQLKRIAFVPVKTVGKFSMTQQRVKELIGLLQGQLEQYDRLAKEAK